MLRGVHTLAERATAALKLVVASSVLSMLNQQRVLFTTWNDNWS